MGLQAKGGAIPPKPNMLAVYGKQKEVKKMGCKVCGHPQTYNDGFGDFELCTSCWRREFMDPQYKEAKEELAEIECEYAHIEEEHHMDAHSVHVVCSEGGYCYIRRADGSCPKGY